MKYFDIRYYAYNLANLIYKDTDSSHNDRYEYYYSLQLILGALFQFFFMMIIAFILGITWKLLIALLPFVTIRHFAGGIHTNSFRSCTIVSTLIMILCVYIGQLVPSYLYAPLLIISFILIMIFSPADHHNNPILSEKRRKKQKIRSICIYFFWIILVPLFPTYSGIIVISIFIQCLTLIKRKVLCCAALNKINT